MAFILWEKLGLHTPSKASLASLGTADSLMQPQRCLLGQDSHPRSISKSWADPGPGPAPVILQSRD